MTSEFSGEFSTLVQEPQSSGGAGQPFNIKRMFNLRAPLIIGIAIVLAVPSMLAAWFLTPVQYRAEAELRFLAAQPSVMEDERPTSTVSYEKFLNTNISLLTGRTILSRVLEDPAISGKDWIKREADPLTFLQSRVTARSSRNSELVHVSVLMHDAAAAKLLIDTIISKYLDYTLNDEATSDASRLNTLLKEQDVRANELDNLVRQKIELQRQMGIPIANLPQLGPSETEAFRESLAKAEEDLTGSQTQVSEIERKLERLGELDQRYSERPSEAIYELGIEDRVGQDPEVVTKRQKLVESETEIAVLAEKHVSSSPRLSVARKDNDVLRRQVAGAEIEARGEILQSLRAQLEQELRTQQELVTDAQTRKDKFTEFIKTREDKAMEASNTLAEMEEIDVKTEETRNLLRNIRNEISRIHMNSKAQARVQLASPATLPTAPDHSKRKQLLALAFLMSCGIGMAAGIVRELTDQQIRFAQDVASVTALPVLATVPHLKEERFLGKVDAPLLSADFPHSPTAEEFRRVMVRIVYPPEGFGEIKTCLVTSPTRGDGKTSMACNLAISLAQAGRRVLLIDVSPRDPSAEWCFGLENGPGLSEVLRGETTVHAVAQLTEFPRLHVLGPGIHSEDLTRRLASRPMLELFDSLEQDFDHIVVDTPPALLMADAKLVAPIVDGVIVVAGVERSTRGMLRRCLRELNEVGADVVGVVLNGIRITRGGYLRRNLDLYYGYSEDREERKVSRTVRPPSEGGFEEDPHERPLPMLIIEEEDDEMDDVGNAADQGDADAEDFDASEKPHDLDIEEVEVEET